MIPTDSLYWAGDRILGVSTEDIDTIFYDRGEVINSMNNVDGWSTTGLTSLDTSTSLFTEGNKSMKLEKTSTSLDYISISQTPHTVDSTLKTFKYDLFITNQLTYNLLRSTDSSVIIHLGSDSSNYNIYNYDSTEFSVGWNFLSTLISDYDSQIGTPNMSSLEYVKIYIYTKLSTDVFSSGDILLDNLRLKRDSFITLTKPIQAFEVSDITDTVRSNTYNSEAILSTGFGNSQNILAHSLCIGGLVDECEDSSSWSIISVDSSLSDNTSFFMQSDKSINISKTGTSSIIADMDKTTSSRVYSGKFCFVVFIKDSTTLSKINKIVSRFGSDSSNYYQFETSSGIGVGMNILCYESSDAISTTGSPLTTSMDYTYLGYNTNNTTDTTVAGDISFDYVHVVNKLIAYNSIIDLIKNNNFQVISRIDIKVV